MLCGKRDAGTSTLMGRGARTDVLVARPHISGTQPRNRRLLPVGQTPLPSHSLPVPSRSFLPGRVTSTAFGLLLYKHVHIAVLYLRHNGTAERHERLPFMGNSIVSTILPEVFVDPPTYSHDVNKAPAVQPADAACTSYLSSGTCLCSGCTCLCSDDLHLFRKERPTCPTLDKVEGGTKTPFSNDQPWLTQSLLFSGRHHAADTRDVHRLSLSLSPSNFSRSLLVLYCIILLPSDETL
jgi:hypothetical protein